MRLDAQYNLLIENVMDTSFFIIDPTHDNLNFTGLNTQPTVVSATYVNATHVDVLFDKELDQAMAEVASNYIITPTTNVVAAVLQLDNMTVRLTTAALGSGAYSLAVFNVIDTDTNLIDLAHCTASFVVP
jgi:hypothetical protein